jgi:hypothetical protein
LNVLTGRLGQVHSLLEDAERREIRALHEEEAEARRLREVFRERAISPSTMERRLQLLTGLALVLIVAAAVLIWLRDSSLPTIAMNAAEGQQTVMPKLTFWLTVVFFSFSWSYVLCGLLHGPRLVRLAALGVFGFGAWSLWRGPFPLDTVRMIPSYLALAAICAVVLYSLREPREERGGPRRLRIATVPVVFVLVLAFYFAFWWRVRALHDVRFFTISFANHLEKLSFALIPVLFVAGIDFAEWGDVASEHVAHVVRRARRTYVLAVATALVAAGALAYQIHVSSFDYLWRGFALAGVLAAVVAAVVLAARIRRPVAGVVPYAVVFAASVVLYALMFGILFATQPAANVSETLTYKHPAVPRFEIEHPLSWQARVLAPSAGFHVFAFTGPKEQFYVVYEEKSTVFTIPDPRSVLFKGPATEHRTDGAWQLTEFRYRTNDGEAWQRKEHGAIWLLVGITPHGNLEQAGPTFEEIKDSWTTEVGAEETGEGEAAAAEAVSAADRAVEVAGLAWLALALGAGALLLVRRLPRPRWLVAGAVYVLVAGLFYVLFQLPRLGFTVLGVSRDALPQLTQGGVEAFVAVATLAALAWLAVRRRLTAERAELVTLLLVLNGGLLAIYWIDRGFASGISASGRFSIVQAVLIIAALVWDIVMSGEAITNRHSRVFPRHARVLVYLGYITAVATAVMFFSSFHFQGTGAGVESRFESETFVEVGLIFLGASLLLTLFVLRLTRLRRAE